jgi:hypothetical protein
LNVNGSNESMEVSCSSPPAHGRWPASITQFCDSKRVKIGELPVLIICPGENVAGGLPLPAGGHLHLHLRLGSANAAENEHQHNRQHTDRHILDISPPPSDHHVEYACFSRAREHGRVARSYLANCSLDICAGRRLLPGADNVRGG